MVLSPGSDVETAACSLRLAPEVLVVNPVLEGGPGHNVWMTDQVVVKFGETTTGAQVESLNVALAAYANPPDSRRPREYYVRINPALRRSALEIAELYRQSALCEFAQPDFVWRPILCDVPDDDYFSYQWHFCNTGQSGGRPDADIDADLAWNITKGDSSVRVSVLDVGFDFIDIGWYFNHEDTDSLSDIMGWDRVGAFWE